MEFLSDLFLGCAAIGAAIYCYVLSRRLAALRSLDGGMGNAIAVLSSQVDDMGRVLNAAREAAGQTGARLDAQTARAEAAARQLELLVASMHDLPDLPDARAPSHGPAYTPTRAPSHWPAQRTDHKPEAQPETQRAQGHGSQPGHRVSRPSGTAMPGPSDAPRPGTADPDPSDRDATPRARILRRRQGPEPR